MSGNEKAPKGSWATIMVVALLLGEAGASAGGVCVVPDRQPPPPRPAQAVGAADSARAVMGSTLALARPRTTMVVRGPS